MPPTAASVHGLGGRSALGGDRLVELEPHAVRIGEEDQPDPPVLEDGDTDPSPQRDEPFDHRRQTADPEAQVVEFVALTVWRLVRVEIQLEQVMAFRVLELFPDASGGHSALADRPEPQPLRVESP